MKPVLVFATLFAVSLAGIVAGYSDLSLLFDAWNWNRVIKEIPVLRAALAVAGGSLVVIFLAFWLCRGDRATYNNAVLGYSYISPFLVVLVLLPGEQSKPGWAPLNMYTMLTVLCLAQVVATLLVRDWFWSRGASET